MPGLFTYRSLLWLLFAVHFALGSALGLTVDEAHYLLYALHPAPSYFDHPPLVGWLQWPLVAWDAPIAVLRLLPGLLWLATVAGVYHLTHRLQAAAGQEATVPVAHAGLWAVLALALAPLLHLLGIGLLPDSLLMLWMVLLMGQTLTLMDAKAAQQPLPWVLLGVLLGLAGLSKYTAILPAAAVAVCLLAAHGWRLLGHVWLWVASALVVRWV